ncbi:MAG: inositol monophosphatase family protein [Bacteroidia bacterium]|nr:inositol monophosphatase [Bacteroidia bacterium]MDW8134067.1 inositol monophosphatase family protein [Bacteroidia bacterium]
MADTVVAIPALIHIVREVGSYLREEFYRFSRSEAEYKTARDPVSYVDREAEKRLKEKCHDLLPEAGFLLEESGSEAHDQELLWVIDPLDGTKNFVHGIPLFAISIALLHHQKPLAGIVYAVLQDEVFWAVRGQGAYLGKECIRVSDVTDPDKLLIATGFMYKEPERAERYFQVLNEVMRRFGGLRRLGSAALDLAYVATGRMDAFFEMDLHPWDISAGSLIVQEASGKVTDFLGEENYIWEGSIVAGNPWAHEAVLELIQQQQLGGK